jgi:hypothetical protein
MTEDQDEALRGESQRLFEVTQTGLSLLKLESTRLAEIADALVEHIGDSLGPYSEKRHDGQHRAHLNTALRDLRHSLRSLRALERHTRVNIELVDRALAADLKPRDGQ